MESRIHVTVIPVNDPPVIAPIPPLLGETGMLNFDLSPYISDIDNEQLSVSVDDTNESQLLIFVNGYDLVIISDVPYTTTLEVLNTRELLGHLFDTTATDIFKIHQLIKHLFC